MISGLMVDETVSQHNKQFKPVDEDENPEEDGREGDGGADKGE